MATDYATAVDQYGKPAALADFVKKAQMVGAVSYRSIWENWNYNRYEFGDRFGSGVPFWYHNSPIRQVAGRMWDWSLEPTAALYFAQDALEPIHAQYHFIKNTVSVNNEHLEPFRGKVKIRVLDSDMRPRLQQEAAVRIPADGVANDVLKIELPNDLSPVHFIRLDVTGDDGKPVADTFYWRLSDTYRGPGTYSGPLYGGLAAIQDLPVVTLQTSAARTSRSDKPVSNREAALAFMIQVKLIEDQSGKPVRPSFYSDNFISLLPGEERVITVETQSAAPTAAHIEIEGRRLSQDGALLGRLSRLFVMVREGEHRSLPGRRARTDGAAAPLAQPRSALLEESRAPAAGAR